MGIAVSGSTGFVGRSLCVELARRNLPFAKIKTARQATENVAIGCLPSDAYDATVLHQTKVLVHLAARVHVMQEAMADPLAAFRAVNTEGTLNLARQAVCAGVKRFVFISSIGVNGSQTTTGKPFSESDKPKPHNAYALSKWEAEQGLMQIADETGLEVVIIRPPLVYGANAPGNFGSLMRAVNRGWPLPLGAVHNQRSLVALDNLVDFIITCITQPKAANQTFLISDSQDLSTTELVCSMAQAADVPARLLPVPVWALEWAGRLVGKRDAVQRLCGNLQIDSSKARHLLGWEPKTSVQEGLRRALVGTPPP
jgi:nucleoside-diphosphate-sugar epimerase